MDEIPESLGKKYGSNTRSLNLSHNCLSSLVRLAAFERIEVLDLDNNKLGKLMIAPMMIC